MTDITRGLHLTVNEKEGTVSLWDDEYVAQSQQGERYVLLPLTPEQRKLLMPPPSPETLLHTIVEEVDEWLQSDDTAGIDFVLYLAPKLKELQAALKTRKPLDHFRPGDGSLG